MKDVTRVHLARQAYDIEVAAKKELEKYMKKLEVFAADEEILADIEIRITELLAERGIVAGGVVTANDVAAVRGTLGEPEEFADEDGVVMSDSGEQSPRRLYRDIDTAMLGGVLSGFARFFGINVLWARLIFVVLLFASVGTAFLVYIVLWLVVPAARTPAEKLQLAGRPVTLAAIREQAISAANEASPQATRVVKRVFFVGGGVIAILVAIGAFIATVSVIAATFIYGFSPNYLSGTAHSWMRWLVFGLFVVSGLLLSLLALLVSVALLRQRTSKKMVVAMGVIIVSGVIAFSSGIGVAFGFAQMMEREAQAAMKTHRVALPVEFSKVRSLVVSAHSASGQSFGIDDDMAVSYIVTADAPRYELRTQFDSEPAIVVKDGAARITLKSVGQKVYRYGYVQPQLVIYGPALEKVEVHQGAFQYTALEQRVQKHFEVTSLQMTQTTIFGSYDTVAVSGAGDIDLSMSSVRKLSTSGEVRVSAGVVYDLTVVQPDVCATSSSDSDGWQPKVSVYGVSSGRMTYNNAVEPLRQHTEPCGSVEIESAGDDEAE